MTVDLLSVSDEAVTINVSQDVDALVEDIRDFVNRYNDVQSAISEYIKFDPETEEKGPLIGDSTVQTIRNRMHSAISTAYNGAGSDFDRLFEVGIRVSGNNQLTFDEDRFREAHAESPEEVEQLFTADESGVGAVLKDMFDGLTDEFDGLITRRDDLLENQKSLLNDRIDQLNVLLDAKRSRLEAQFVALEMAIANIQDQEAALANLPKP